MARDKNSRRFPTLPAAAVLALVYFVVAKLALKLAFVHASASAVWPPTGIALAALLLFGYRLWPAIFVSAFLVNLNTVGNFSTSFFIGAGNTLEAICGAWMVNRFAGGLRVFDRPQNVFKFAGVAILCTVVSPTFGVTSLVLGGFADWTNYGTIWTTWWLGDFAGALVVAPLILLWSTAPPRHWNRRDAVEVGVLLLLLFVLAESVFGGWVSVSTLSYPISFICGPIVIWTAFRFTQRETATGIFLLSTVGIWGTLHRFGPFTMPTENESLITLQAWTAVLAITAMALSSAMSEHRRAQATLAQQKSEVEAANRTKDNFLAMLSHELRTPLTPVLAALETLEREPGPSQDTKSALAMIRRNIELEGQLIDDLLDLTRIAKDKLQLKFDPLDAHEIIANVAEMCRAESDARQLHVHLHLRAGAHYVSADTAKFQQIIWNLLKNAIKFTPAHGEITISSSNPEPQVFSLTMRDTGVGIDPEIIDRIFNPFEQGERSFQRRYGGLGLGLAISKSLAQAHGATLTAKSDGRDRGSTFVLTMDTVSPPKPAAAAAPEPAGTRSLRILLVEDHQDTCTALEKLLIRRGHLVAATHNVRSAMETAARNQFDLLISDVALPDGSGMELMSYLSAMSGMRGIAISGFGMNGDIERSLGAGFVEHLVKPIKIDKLESAIERATAVGAAAPSHSALKR